MPGVCCINGCDHTCIKNSMCSFKRFPRRFDLLEKWCFEVKQVNGSSWKPKEHHRVCSCHFDRDDYFVKDNNRKMFKKNAVPRIFANRPEPSNTMEVTTPSLAQPMFPVTVPVSIRPALPSSFPQMTANSFAPASRPMGYLIPVQAVGGSLPLSCTPLVSTSNQISLPLNIFSTPVPATTKVSPNQSLPVKTFLSSTQNVPVKSSVPAKQKTQVKTGVSPSKCLPDTNVIPPEQNQVKPSVSSKQNVPATAVVPPKQNKTVKLSVSSKQDLDVPLKERLQAKTSALLKQSVPVKEVDTPETTESQLVPKIFQGLQKVLSNLKPLHPVEEEDFLPVDESEETLEEFDGECIKRNLSYVRDLCRVCANPKAQDEEEMVQILSKKGEKMRLADKILQLLPIAFSAKEDRLPMQVCRTCIKSLDLCYDLVMCCSMADVKLHRLIMLEDERVGSPIQCAGNVCETLLEKEGQSEGEDNADYTPWSPPSSPPASEQTTHCTYPECQFECSDTKQMRNHIETSHDVMLCTKCNAWYDKAVDLLNHMKMSHNNQFWCDTCGAVVNRRNLSKHMLKHMPRNLPCSYCDKKFNQKILLKRHEETHDKRRLFVCDLCYKNFPNIRYLHVHMKRSHLKDWIYKCKKCTLETTCIKKIQLHVLTDHKVEKQNDDDLMFTRYSKHKCNVCDEYFASEFYLTRHKWKNSCNKIRHKFSLNKLTKCPDCDEVFMGPSALGRHAKDIHKKSRDVSNVAHLAKDGSYNCIHCGKNYISQFLLRQHIRSHTNEKPYKCDRCDKCFAYSVGLREHEAMAHLDEARFQCKQCSKMCHSRGKFNKHMLTHTKPEKCQYCNKGFALKGQLRVHERIHTGDKPYTCPICSRGFTQKQEMEFHHLSHLNDKKFRCSNCTFKNNKLQDVEAHIKTYHLPSEDAKVLKRDLNDTASWDEETPTKITKMAEEVIEVCVTDGSTHDSEEVIEVTLPLGVLPLNYFSAQ